MPDPRLGIRPLGGLGEISEGDDLAALINAAAEAPLPGDGILVISHKAVSKAEGAVRRLVDVVPGEEAVRLAAEQDRDPAHVQVILDESVELLRSEHGVLICVTRHGFVCANAGVDASNSGDGATVTLLPRDPDRSARSIRAGLRAIAGVAPAVVIADSFGRAWRLGQVDIAIGCAGVIPIDDWKGRGDRDGRPLSATAPAIADAVAAAADLARSKDSGEPAVLLEGLGRFVTAEDGPGAGVLLRPEGEDLFRR